jgi:hypothetical protein
MLYRRGGKWWFKFRFAGRLFREPAKTTERKRRLQLEEGYHGIKKRQPPQTLKSAAAAWLELKQPTVAPKTHRIEKTHLSHILPVLGPKFISDIEPDDISRYQQARLRDKAAPKTVNLEVGTIRAIMRRHRLWANLQPDVRMLAVSEDHGKALAPAHESGCSTAVRTAGHGRCCPRSCLRSTQACGTRSFGCFVGSRSISRAGPCASARARQRRGPAA